MSLLRLVALAALTFVLAPASAFALKYLGHWIGDIHQPIHVAFKDDEWGVYIDERGSPCKYNLHEVWDTCIIEETLGRDTQRVANGLRQRLSDLVRRNWSADSVPTWANESYKIITTPDSLYCVKEDGQCKYERGNAELERNEPRRMVEIGLPFVKNHTLTLADRLLRAGVRLAERLNTILDPPPSP